MSLGMSKLRSIEHVRNFEKINSLFDVVDKKGQGTFATVFTVRAKTSPDSDTYALKMIIPTTDLRRVENELRILRQLNGKHGVVRMLSAMRVKDHIFILMPFIDHVSFSSYYLTFRERDIRKYLFHLLRALEYVHRYGIIHRDIKPSNFLFDRRTQKYTLIDFGLAHSQVEGDVDKSWNPHVIQSPATTSKRKSLQSPGSAPPQTPKSARFIDQDSPLFFSPKVLDNPPVVKPRLVSILSTSCRSSNSGNPLNPLSQSLPGSGGGSTEEKCVCGNRLSVCRCCRNYAKPSPVRRGGTVGYRPPEVVFRSAKQTTAVDVWAVGVIMLTFLSGRYPFMKLDDDLEVIHAFTHLLGSERMQQGAYAVGKRLLVDPKPPALADDETPTMYLRKRLVNIRKNDRKLVAPPPVMSPSASTSQSNTIALPNNYRFPFSAYELCTRLLDPIPSRRISAEEAARHLYILGSESKGSHAAPKAKTVSV